MKRKKALDQLSRLHLYGLLFTFSFFKGSLNLLATYSGTRDSKFLPLLKGPSLLAACKLPQWRPGTVVLRDCHVSPFQTRCFQKLQYLAEPILAVSGCCRHRCDWPPPPAAASGRCPGPSLPNCGPIMQNTLSVILTAICVSRLIKNWWEFSFSWKSVFRRK